MTVHDPNISGTARKRIAVIQLSSSDTNDAIVAV